MNEDQLSDALKGSVPPAPDPSGWAGEARRRARRRQGLTAGAVVAVLAAIATPLALTWSTPPAEILATPAPSEPASAPLVPDICRDPVTDAVPLVDGDLPDGASKVWLCGRSDTGSVVEYVGFPDPLMTRADEAVAAFNALERSEGVLDCMVPAPGEVIADYTVVVEYPDGTHRAVRTAGCADLRDVTDMFTVFRGDGAGFLAQLQEYWALERAGFTFAGTSGLCDSAVASVLRPLDLTGLSRAVACAGDGTPVELDAALTADVLASVVEAATLDTAAPAPEPPALILLTPTGDPVSLVREDDGTYWWDDAGLMHVWAPDVELDRRITEARGGDGSTPAPTATPPTATPTATLSDERGAGLVPAVCDAVQSGELAAPDLPAAENLPTGAARAWLCGDLWGRLGGVGPIEPLTTDPDRLVEAINDLPASTADVCTEMLGLTVHVVIDYPDGSRRVVAAETVNCQFVGGWGGREGGSGLLDEAIGMWEAQREASPEPFTDAVDVCGDLAATGLGTYGLDSLLDVDRAALYRGVVCGLPEGESDQSAVVQRDLPGDIAIALTQATPVPLADWSMEATVPAVVMLNQFGDPVAYPVDGEHGIMLEDGMAWLPDGDLADQWAETLAGLSVP